MFGWTLIKNTELRLIKNLADMELKQAISRAILAEEYAHKCEKLIDHERERIDGERNRADRIADAVFTSNGLPPVSTVGVSEQKAIEDKTTLIRADAMREMAEVFQETWDEATIEESLEAPDVAATP